MKKTNVFIENNAALKSRDLYLKENCQNRSLSDETHDFLPSTCIYCYKRAFTLSIHHVFQDYLKQIARIPTLFDPLSGIPAARRTDRFGTT